MFPLPPMPRGCEIAVTRDGTTLRLAWREPEPSLLATWNAVASIGFLTLWTLLGVAIVSVALLDERWQALLMVPFWFVIVAFLFGHARIYFEERRAESVTLTPTAMTYDPGSSPMVLMGQFNYFYIKKHMGKWGHLTEPFKSRRPVTVTKEGIPLRFENERLTLFAEQREHVIGIGLDQADRRWLHAVLEEWLRPATPSGA